MRSWERAMGQMLMILRVLGLRPATAVIPITCLKDEHGKGSSKGRTKRSRGKMGVNT